MPDTLVVLDTGETLCGPIWEWRPREGWFTIVGHDERILFERVVSATTKMQRTSVLRIEDRDELERAREEGWVHPEPIPLVAHIQAGATDWAVRYTARMIGYTDKRAALKTLRNREEFQDSPIQDILQVLNSPNGYLLLEHDDWFNSGDTARFHKAVESLRAGGLVIETHSYQTDPL